MNRPWPSRRSFTDWDRMMRRRAKPRRWGNRPTVRFLRIIFPRWRITIRGLWRSRGRCPTGRGWTGFSRNIWTDTSMWVSRKSTRCSLPQGWQPKGLSLSVRSIRPSFSGRMIKSSTTSVCKICQWCFVWIEGVFRVMTVRPITVFLIFRTYGGCPT